MRLLLFLVAVALARVDDPRVITSTRWEPCALPDNGQLDFIFAHNAVRNVTLTVECRRQRVPLEWRTTSTKTMLSLSEHATASCAPSGEMAKPCGFFPVSTLVSTAPASTPMRTT